MRGSASTFTTNHRAASPDESKSGIVSLQSPTSSYGSRAPLGPTETHTLRDSYLTIAVFALTFAQRAVCFRGLPMHATGRPGRSAESRRTRSERSSRSS
jgi:hypothetical protein